ncbi:MAG: TRAP transporter small permease [Desulfobacterales bacterium]|nr:MAG: TRAP transporter small permease [Desulfobacterales bacterium]
MERWERIITRIEETLAAVAGLLLVFIIFSICLSIALRTLNLQAPLWSVQFNEYSLLWITFLGGAWLLSKRRHVSLDILSRRLGDRGLARLNVFHAVLGLLVCGALTWISGAVTWDHFRRGVIDVRAVDVPKHWILAVVFVGFLLLALRFLCNLLQEIRQMQEDD